MIIIRPSLTTQTITVIARYQPSNLEFFRLNFLNEETQQESSISVSDINYVNGYLILTFDLECLEGESFNLEIKEENNVLYRDKVFATDTVDLENYKLSNGSIL